MIAKAIVNDNNKISLFKDNFCSANRIQEENSISDALSSEK